MLTNLKSNRQFDVLWLLVLVIYIFAGLQITTFHGDEAMQIYMSNDYATAFIEGEPQRLTSTGPFGMDADAGLRLINGSVNRYSIGLGWHLAGFSDGDLPPAPGWDWGVDYDTNLEVGFRSPDALLWASRGSSTLFLALSAIVMFGIGWQFGGRPVAYLASGLYALNPVLLLNGRRAMMEGSLLFFGLLTILIALIICRRRAHWGWWLALILSGSLALASKHSGLVFVGGALGWVFLNALLSRERSKILTATAKLIGSGLLIIALFIALSPALWNDPLARFQDLLVARTDLIEIQVNADPAAPTTLVERVEGMLTHPFIADVWHYEAGGWTSFAPIGDEINQYMASPLSGLQAGPILGSVLTLLVLVGAVTVLRRGLGFHLGVFVWLAITAAMLLINPLPWQRYYLPLIPIFILLASQGIVDLIAIIVHGTVQESHLPAETIRPTL